jgi:hypothetical protein
MRTLLRVAVGCLLGAALIATTAPARAADGDENVPIDTQILRGFMEQLGLRRDGEAINYEERAPLVIPPNRDLPPPERSDAVLAHNPAWPKDPDVKRRKDEAERERTAIRRAGESFEHDNRPLRPDEITPGPKPRGMAQRSDDVNQGSSNGVGGRLTPAQLDTKPNVFSRIFGTDKPEISSFTGEPPRTALTAPPRGYQTPSPDQPYGVGKSAAVPKAQDYLLTHGTIDDKR